MEAKSIAFPTLAQALKKEILPEERGYELLEFLDNNDGQSIYQISKKTWMRSKVGTLLRVKIGKEGAG
jgi:hypothetical protein